MKDMLGREDAVTVGRALELLSEALPDRRPLVIDANIEEALGMVCAEEIGRAHV